MNKSLFVLITSGLIFSTTAPVFAEGSTSVEIEILYTVEIGQEKHLVHFMMCAGDETVHQPSVIIHTPQQTLEISFTKILNANTCQNYEIVAHAKNADKIEVNTS